MARYLIETKPGKTKFGHLLQTKEPVDDLVKRFPKANKSEKDILAALKADKDIKITVLETGAKAKGADQ